jgi:hypothetical protein
MAAMTNVGDVAVALTFLAGNLAGQVAAFLSNY